MKLSFAEKWIQLEIIMLSKISQAQKPCFHSYIESSSRKMMMMMMKIIIVIIMEHEHKGAVSG
jgi:hypothetical protein